MISGLVLIGNLMLVYMDNGNLCFPLDTFTAVNERIMYKCRGGFSHDHGCYKLESSWPASPTIIPKIQQLTRKNTTEATAGVRTGIPRTKYLFTWSLAGLSSVFPGQLLDLGYNRW